MLETIVVDSWDFDGCLSHRQNEQLSPIELIERNHVFIEARKQAHTPDMRYVMVGSARQSHAADLYCKAYNNTTSCFPLYPALSKALGAKFDPLLMADIYGNLSPGMSFHRIMRRTYIGAYHNWVSDITKITLIYAQMQHIAHKHPGTSIVFNFYDDRIDILSDLYDFFDNNRFALPPKLSLGLHCYRNGVDFGSLSKIVEPNEKRAFFDRNYKKTVREMGKYILNSPDYTSNELEDILVSRYTESRILKNMFQGFIGDAPKASTPEVASEDKQDKLAVTQHSL